MVYRSVVFCLFLVGCASSIPPAFLDESPQLVETTSLPPLPASVVRTREVNLEVKLHVGADGSVRDLIWLSSSGNEEWDNLAASRIKTWKYTPASTEGKNVAVWVLQSVRVVTVESEMIFLSEIVNPDRATADSVYTMLKAGADFGELARKYSNSKTAERGGYKGKVDLSVFPLAVRDQLSRLGEEEFTEPLRVGVNYVIYKRVNRDPVVG